MEESLFKHVFCNIVLLRNIYRHVRLFKKNEIMVINDLKSLQEYNEKEYIQSLVYYGDQLSEGDLPTNGVLKTLEINCNYYQVIGNVIPYGVEMITFKWVRLYETPLFSTLPSTINTLKNVVIIGPGYNGEFGLEGDNYCGSYIIDTNGEDIRYNCFFNKSKKDYSIPPNITSISFQECPNISGQGETSIIIPNTIKHLEFDKKWDNEGYILRVGDIPSSLVSLELGKTHFNKDVLSVSNLTKLSITREYFELYKLELPNSILKLEINCCGCVIHDQKDLFNFITPNFKSLKLLRYQIGVKFDSNLHLCKSITKLSISGFSDEDIGIQTNSLPPNLTNLKLCLYENNIPGYSIPNSVQSLSINIDSLGQINKYPESLTNLVLTHDFITVNDQNLIKMIPKLPSSPISLSLPSKFNSLKLTFPSNIDVKYIGPNSH